MAQVFALFLAGVVALTHAAVGPSKSQVSETLENLLRSIEDESHSAEKLSSSREEWCSATVKSQTITLRSTEGGVEQMQSELHDHQAAADEVRETIRQLKSEMAVIDVGINRTQNVLHTQRAESSGELRGVVKRGNESGLVALVDNQQQSLLSKQSQLEVEYPLLAQLEELIAQAHRRVTAREASLSTGKEFMSAVDAACQQTSRRSDVQQEFRTDAAEKISAAVQALKGPSAAQNTSMDESEPQSFFLQLATHRHRVKGMGSKMRKSPIHKVESETAPELQKLLVKLESDKSGAKDHAEWCSQEHSRNEFSLVQKQDEVNRLEAEIKAHGNAEAQLAHDLESVSASIQAFEAASKKLTKITKEEAAFAKSSAKDHQIATRILDQAVAILTRMGEGESARSLRDAQTSFDGMSKASDAASKEVSESGDRAAQSALAFAQSQGLEKSDIEQAVDEHAQRRVVTTQSQKVSKAELEAIQSYLQQLSKECSSQAEAEEESQRQTQVDVLEDAQRALRGEALATSTGDVSSDLKNKDLSPIERAAMELGVPTN